MIVFLALPYFTYVIGQRFSFGRERQNLLVVRILIFFLVVGGAMTAAAPNIVYLIIGENSHLKPHHMISFLEYSYWTESYP